MQTHLTSHPAETSQEGHRVIWAYLRVSTSDQDTETQRSALINYSLDHYRVTPTENHETASSRIDWRARGIGVILANAAPGDVVLCTEVSRLARSTLEVLEIMQTAANRGVTIIAVKSALVMDGSQSSRIVSTVLGLAAEIEREFIRTRTRMGLDAARERGAVLGRPRGPARTLKLDGHRSEINRLLDLAISHTAIAKLIGCSRSTLIRWISRQPDHAKEGSTP